MYKFRKENWERKFEGTFPKYMSTTGREYGYFHDPYHYGHHYYDKDRSPQYPAWQRLYPYWTSAPPVPRTPRPPTTSLGNNPRRKHPTGPFYDYDDENNMWKVLTQHELEMKRRRGEIHEPRPPTGRPPTGRPPTGRPPTGRPPTTRSPVRLPPIETHQYYYGAPHPPGGYEQEWSNGQWTSGVQYDPIYRPRTSRRVRKAGLNEKFFRFNYYNPWKPIPTARRFR